MIVRVQVKMRRPPCEWSNMRETTEAESRHDSCSGPKGVILSNMREKHCMNELTYA